MTALLNTLLTSFVLVQSGEVFGEKIIMTSPQGASHVHQQLEFGTELLRNGHEVYVAVGSRYPQQDAILKRGLKVLTYNIPDDVMYGISREYELFITYVAFNKTTDIPRTSEMVNRDCTLMMEDQKFLDQVQKLTFDLALVEPFALSPCTLLLPHYLRIPYITLVTIVLPWRFRLPALPSFLPTLSPFAVFTKTTFIGRIENFIALIAFETGILIPALRNTTLLKLYAPELGSWDELIGNSELHFVAADNNMAAALPLFPNFVTVPGLTCRPAARLDPILDQIANNNTNGVILLSFGATAYLMPKNVVIKFLEAFAKLKETVVARFPVIEGVEIPKNVHLLKWIPQNDILGHPNTKLFITHCGSGGQHEALYHAVPMIGFPLFGEQAMNCRIAEEKGFGLTMSITDFSSTELYNNIIEVLDNSKYKSAIEHASERFRAQPMSAQEKVRFWVDYVLRYGGKHLRSPANDLPLYQFLMLDVLCVLTLLLITGLCLVKTLIKFLKRRIYGHKKKPKVKFQ